MLQGVRKIFTSISSRISAVRTMKPRKRPPTKQIAKPVILCTRRRVKEHIEYESGL